MKLKILNVIGSLSKGGAELQCRLLANHLDPSRYEVSILCFDEGPNPDLAPEVKPVFVERGSRYHLLSLGRRIDAAVAAEQPHIVQAWLPEVISVPAAIAAFRRNIPVISGHRNTLACRGDWVKALRDFLRLPQYVLARKIVSNFSVAEEPFFFRWLYHLKAGQCIFNGIDTYALRSLAARQLPVRAEYRLVYAGRLAPQKNLSIAFHTLKRLIESGRDVHLTLFGEGTPSYEGKLRILLEELSIADRVTFYGQCRDWHAYADDATALIFPTKGEGTSNVILEALSIGLPVIISDIAMSRQLLQNGKNAWIVPSTSDVVWAERVGFLLNNPDLRRTLREEGKRLSERFAVNKMIENYEKIYQELTI